MPVGRTLRLVLLGLAAASSLPSGGCILPYAYPHLCHVPAVHAGPEPAAVRAFRVDVTGDVLDAGESDEYVLTPVDVSSAGRVGSQTRLSLEYGIYVVGVAINYPVHHGHSTLLRLYRPGYRLVEVRAWEWPDTVAWEPAADVEEQEKAVDALLAAPGIEAPRFGFGYGLGTAFLRGGQSAPGSAALGHRAALAFTADEYERVAGLVDPGSEGGKARQERLLGKVRAARARAAE